MKRLIKYFSFRRKLSFFDYFITGVFLILGIAAFIFFFRKTTWVTVRVRVTDRDVVFVYSNPPSWFVYLFKKGMREADSLGRTTAEITDVYYYDAITDVDSRTNMSKKTVYLTLKLKANYNKRTGEYKYKGMPLSSGEVLRVNLGTILVHGLITDMDGVKNPFETVHPVVRILIKDFNPVFPGTTGVDESLADALSIGDKILDSKGEVAAEVLDKEVYPAQMTTVDNFGIPHTFIHPRLKDIYLNLRLSAQKIGNEVYFFDDFLIKINNYIPLSFPKIAVYGNIIRIISM